MNTENDIKEFGFRHISINTVYNGLERNTVQGLSFLVSSVIPFCTFFSPNLLILVEQVWGFAISD